MVGTVRQLRQSNRDMTVRGTSYDAFPVAECATAHRSSQRREQRWRSRLGLGSMCSWCIQQPLCEIRSTATASCNYIGIENGKKACGLLRCLLGLDLRGCKLPHWYVAGLFAACANACAALPSYICYSGIERLLDKASPHTHFLIQRTCPCCAHSTVTASFIMGDASTVSVGELNDVRDTEKIDNGPVGKDVYMLTRDDIESSRCAIRRSND